MQTFILRNGKSIPADEVFFAWTSGELARMLAARAMQTHPIDRHHLLSGIASTAYAQRERPEMRRLFLETAQQHVAEFATLAPVMAADFGGRLPRVPTFASLATVLAEDGKFEEAIAVCEKALSFGLHDGTKGDFPARIARIRKAALKTSRAV